MTPRLTPAMQKEIAAWPIEDRDHFEERAAIRTFCAGESKDEAEVAAYLEVRANRTRAARKQEG